MFFVMVMETATVNAIVGRMSLFSLRTIRSVSGLRETSPMT
jgi:hypothetical protein